MAERWFRLLVRAYPSSFREEMGDDMVEAFRDRARDAHRQSGVISILTLCASATVDTIRNGLGEHMRPANLWPRSGQWRRVARIGLTGMAGELRRAPRVARTSPGEYLMRFLDDLRQDVRYSVRGLLQVPAFSSVVILTLALGIGANPAIFSVVNALLLTPLPYKDPDRLVRLVETVPAEESPNGQAVRVSGIRQREFLEWREQSRTLSHMATDSPVSMTLSGRGEAVRLTGRRVSPELPVCFLMTVQNSGKPEQWVVAGDALPVLRQAGWRFGPAGQVKPGISTSVSVFLPKHGSIAAQTLGAKLREAMPTGISAVTDTALKAGRLAQGVEVKLADGQTLPFGPPK